MKCLTKEGNKAIGRTLLTAIFAEEKIIQSMSIDWNASFVMQNEIAEHIDRLTYLVGLLKDFLPEEQ